MDLISSIMSGKKLDDSRQQARDAPTLQFGDNMAAARISEGEQLRNKAMQNLRERRLRLKSSAIFNAKQQALQTVDATSEKRDSDMSEEEVDEYIAKGRETVDLTIEQSNVNDDEGLDDMDDFDLLDATIDPTDVQSLSKRRQLELEIEYESMKIKSKLLWKLAISE